ncbi:MAG: hypothetical protein WBA28_01510 [Microbacteriaceae bacterium]
MAQNTSQHRAAFQAVPVATTWLLSGSRAILALLGGLFITFSFSITSIALALIVFGSYTVLYGLAILLWFPKVQDRAVKNASLIIAVTNIAAGAVGLIFIQSETISTFLLLVTIWAAITGFAELYLGFAKKGKFAEHRDWLFAGAMSCFLALGMLLIDPNYRKDYLVPGGSAAPDYAGTVTGSLFGIGVFGVYLIVIGVFLFIGAYSLRNPELDTAAEGNGN